MDILLVAMGLVCIPVACLISIRAERRDLPQPGSVTLLYGLALAIIAGGLAVAVGGDSDGLPLDRLTLMVLAAVLALLFFCLRTRHRKLTLLHQTQHEAVRLHQHVLDSVNDAVLLTRDQTIVYANAAFFRMLQVEAEDCIGQPWPRFVAPEEVDALMALHERQTPDQTVADHIEVTICSPGGRRLCVQAHVGTAMHQGHEARLTVLRDLTDQKTVIAYLRESEAKYRQIFEGDLSALCIIDTVTREIVDANPAACAMYGYSRQEMLSLRYDDLAARPSTAVDAMEAMVSSGMLPPPHDWHVRYDGIPFPVDLSAGTCQLGYRSVVCASIRDVTTRSGAERAEREAREAAEHASQAKTRFLAMMSHELRTPMGVVMGMLEELQRSGLEPRHATHVDTAIHAADLLLHTIDDVLDYAKLESDDLVFEELDFDCHGLLRDITRHHGAVAEAKGLPLALDIDPALPRWLHGDPRRVRQVISQLLSNAIKFTEKGSVHLFARRGKAASAGKAAQHVGLEVAVRDTGIGIATANLETIFVPFQQVDASSTRRAGGAGLGLAVARHLATRMHGDIMVESFPDVGSTFTFTAALAPGQPVEDAPPPVACRALNLLLVDDNRLNLTVITLTLHRMGHRVTEAHNGVQAMHALAAAKEDAPFDIILMDIEMPVLDGMEATRRIRAGEAGERYRAIPILIMTAHSKNLFHDQCMEAGATAFVTKPIKRSVVEPLFAAIAGDAPADDATARGTVAEDTVAKVTVAEDAPTPPVAADGHAQPQAHGSPCAKPSPALWDTEGIMRRLECDASFLNELGTMFLEEAPTHVRQIKASLAAGDLPTAATAAHALKNECLNVGADICRGQSEALVQAARNGDSTSAHAAFSSLEEDMETLLRLMRRTLPL
ncbi:MAG: ATP-binding protein [Desulfovibrionaceae bacterium]